MTLSNNQVKEIILGGVSPEILLSRKNSRELNSHFTGKGSLEVLEKLDSYETQGQKILREKLHKSNRSVFAFLTRPTDKIFTAKGGSVGYNLPQEQIRLIKSKISQMSDGISIKKYLKKNVIAPYIVDPNGVLFVDLDPKGMIETHVIGIHKIFWYSKKGNSVEGLIFESLSRNVKTEKQIDKLPTELQEVARLQAAKKYYRVIDDKLDRIFVLENGDVIEVTGDRLKNFFGYVPARILGDTKNYNNDIFDSIFSDVMEDAKELLRDVSVKTVHKLAHAYPRYWSYAQACVRCSGEGEINSGTTEAPDINNCQSCGGTGQKQRTNPSDETILDVPQGDDPTIAPNVAGFVSPDFQMMKMYEQGVGDIRNLMFHSIWGTTLDGSGKRETATGRVIDFQPVQDRLKDISDTFSSLHKFLLDAYGKIVLRNPNYESSVSYGTRYVLQSTEELHKKYLDTSKEKVSDIVKLDALDQYFDAEYQTDSIELAKKKKLARIEPFPTMGIMDIMGMAEVDEKDRKRKLYFSQWVSSITDAQIILSTEKQLSELLNAYIADRTLTKKEE